MDIKEIARNFVVPRLGVRQRFFESAWGIISSSAEESGTPDRLKYASERLAIVGDENSEAVLAVMIFVDASKQIGPKPNADKLVVAIQAAASKYETNERLLREILDYVRGVKAGQQPRLRTVVQLWTNEFGEHSGPMEIESEAVKDYVGRKDEFEMLIVDDGKSVSRKVGDVYVNGKQLEGASDEPGVLSSGAYRLLIHLLKKDGNGGTSFDVAKAVWPYDGIFIGEMEKAWTKHESRPTRYRNPFKGLDGRIKKEKAILRDFLRHRLGVELGTDDSQEVSHHVLDKVPKFCLLEVVK